MRSRGCGRIGRCCLAPIHRNQIAKETSLKHIITQLRSSNHTSAALRLILPFKRASPRIIKSRPPSSRFHPLRYWVRATECRKLALPTLKSTIDLIGKSLWPSMIRQMRNSSAFVIWATLLQSNLSKTTQVMTLEFCRQKWFARLRQTGDLLRPTWRYRLTQCQKWRKYSCSKSNHHLGIVISMSSRSQIGWRLWKSWRKSLRKKSNSFIICTLFSSRTWQRSRNKSV